MAVTEHAFLHAQLAERRRRLEAARASSPEDATLAELLEQVDSALERMSAGTYGLCETCHDPIEGERLLADPLVRYCLDHLTAQQQRALEEDLGLAAQIQRGLLPQQDLRWGDWEVHYHYEPAGLVSGDYCDLIQTDSRAEDLFFVLGDVSGKGVAASMLMTQLHAMFRSLASVGLPLDQMVTLANRVFCETALAGQYATLVCGRAGRSGAVEISNAGHCPALLVGKGGVRQVESTSVPLGMFGTGHYPLERFHLEPGDSLFLYTDGLSESRGPAHTEYGVERLSRFVAERNGLAPRALIAACLEDVRKFSSGAPKTDDLTIMVLRRI